MVIAKCGVVRIQILVDDKLRSLFILTPFAYLTMEKIPTCINEIELSTLWPLHYTRRLLLLILTSELELTCVTMTISQFFLYRVNVGSNDAQRPTRYLFHRADWTNFTVRALITRNMVEGENLKEVVNLVTKTITSAADASIPKSGLIFPKNRKPWWNKYCTDTNRYQRRAWNVFRRHPTSANQIAFQRAKSIALWARRKSERGHWIKFVSDINSSVSAKDVWENARRVCGIYPEKRISCLRKNGQEVRNISEMVDVLAEAFASIYSASNNTEPFLTHKNHMERIKLRFQTTTSLTTLT
ncbi:hypothetical protein AVEN_184579-1 [Araneus ventricosus]|uniref:Uncharacterized protein n=1 Tax=Araneus ventricosus TaxID=182803 RepID=A0A4Y2G4D4_ARAVE|nr:hypothetical protein AVEN_184579-1 [Araneus ventricosus]